MRHWKEYKLGEIAELRREGFMPNNDIVLPYIGLEHIEPESLSLNGIGKSTDVTSQKSKFYPNDVLYGKLRPYFKKVFSPTFEGICSTDIYVVKAKNGINSRYLFYLLATDEFTQLANSGSTGTKMPRADWKHLSDTLWNIPDYPTQTAIASILSSLDQKIELNNAINRNLEALAQALFKQWFVEFEFPVDQNGNFSPLTGEMSEGQRGYKSSGGEMVESELGMIPKGWRVGSIYEASDVIYGAPFKSSLFNQEKKGYPLIRIRDLKTYAPQFWTEENHPKGVIIRAGELVVGMDAEFRPHIWLGEEAYLNQRLCHFKPKGYFTRLFVCETIRPQLMFHENSSVGTTVIHLRKKEIDLFKTLIPPDIILQVFGKMTEPLLEQIVNNSKENRNLKSLRDTLLPKLISGELEVKDIEVGLEIEN